jgi:hypothetical protein
MSEPKDVPEANIDRCAPRPPDTLGVIVHDPARCHDGLTLCHSSGERNCRLIDLEGRAVHEWSIDRGPRWHECRLLDNGHLLVIANENAYSPTGISRHWLIELDRDGNIVWESHARCHHDGERLANGNTVVVCNGLAHYPELFSEPLIYDYLQEIDPEGRSVWSWHYATHQHELDLPAIEPPPGLGDWPHINTVQVLPDTPAAGADRRFREGNLLVSPRHLHRIFIVDRETGDIVWQWGEGILRGQHQPTMLPGGTILLFDNGWGPPMRGWSQVLEIEPVAGRIVWRYRTDPTTDFWSPVGSGAQRLVNGNTLICAMNWNEPGRVFEVTPEGEIVWEYWNPDSTSFYRAYRFARDSEAVRNLLG